VTLKVGGTTTSRHVEDFFVRAGGRTIWFIEAGAISASATRREGVLERWPTALYRAERRGRTVPRDMARGADHAAVPFWGAKTPERGT
jgi:hypothetical protein